MQQVQLEPAFVLHHQAYRDSSLLLEIFSPEHGRQGVVARGARAAKSRWRGLLQPFQPLLLSWKTRGELGSLLEAESAGHACRLKGQALFAGFYLNELLLRLLPRGLAEGDCYAAYIEALRRLGDGEIEAPLRIFEKRLLDSLGYGLQLDCDAITGEMLEPAVLYRYEYERGPVAVSGTEQGPLVIEGATLLALAAESLSGTEQLKQAKQLLQRTLRLYLGDRPLKTREVLRAMQKGKTA